VSLGCLPLEPACLLLEPACLRVPAPSVFGDLNSSSKSVVWPLNTVPSGSIHESVVLLRFLANIRGRVSTLKGSFQGIRLRGSCWLKVRAAGSSPVGTGVVVEEVEEADAKVEEVDAEMEEVDAEMEEGDEEVEEVDTAGADEVDKAGNEEVDGLDKKRGDENNDVEAAEEEEDT